MWTSPVSRAGCVEVDVASQACSKLKGSVLEFGPKTGHLGQRRSDFLPSVVQADRGADTAGFISLQIGAMTTGSSSMTVPWTALACG